MRVTRSANVARELLATSRLQPFWPPHPRRPSVELLVHSAIAEDNAKAYKQDLQRIALASERANEAAVASGRAMNMVSALEREVQLHLQGMLGWRWPPTRMNAARMRLRSVHESKSRSVSEGPSAFHEDATDQMGNDVSSPRDDQ